MSHCKEIIFVLPLPRPLEIVFVDIIPSISNSLIKSKIRLYVTESPLETNLYASYNFPDVISSFSLVRFNKASSTLCCWVGNVTIISVILLYVSNF